MSSLSPSSAGAGAGSSSIPLIDDIRDFGIPAGAGASSTPLVASAAGAGAGSSSIPFIDDIGFSDFEIPAEARGSTPLSPSYEGDEGGSPSTPDDTGFSGFRIPAGAGNSSASLSSLLPYSAAGAGAGSSSTPQVQHSSKQQAAPKTRYFSELKELIERTVRTPRSCSSVMEKITKKNVNEQDENGRTVLSLVAESGSPQLIEPLIKLGAIVDALDHQDHSPLYHAAKAGRVQILPLLINAGANPNGINARRLTKPLSKRTRDRIQSIFARSIQPPGQRKDPQQNSQTSDSQSKKGSNQAEALKPATHGGGGSSSSTETVDPAMTESLKRPSQAQRLSDQPKLATLPAQNLASDGGSSKNATQISAAGAGAGSSSTPQVQYLSQQQIAPKTRYFLELEELIERTVVSASSCSSVMEKITNKNVNEQDGKGRSVLSLAAELGSPQLIKPLIDLGATVDAFDHQGCSPLYHAVKAGRVQIVQLLINAGASSYGINARNLTEGLSERLRKTIQNMLARSIQPQSQTSDSQSKEGSNQAEALNPATHGGGDSSSSTETVDPAMTEILKRPRPARVNSNPKRITLSNVSAIGDGLNPLLCQMWDPND